MSQIILVPAGATTRQDALYEKILGALLGGAIADALGWPTEFARRPTDLERFGVSYPVRSMVPWHKRSGGRFFTRIDYVQPGEYSDDTQLAICVARSLRPDGSVDNDYFAHQELRYWLDYARGAGATVTAAAKAASRKRSDWRWNYFRFTRGRHQSDYRDAGANGAAMRIAPIVLGNLWSPERSFIEIWKNAITTHGHPRAIVGAVVYGEALRRAQTQVVTDATELVAGLLDYIDEVAVPRTDPDVRTWLDLWNSEVVATFDDRLSECKREMRSLLERVLDRRDEPLRSTYEQIGCLDPASRGSGTNSVAGALAVFLRHSRAFGRTALAAANELGSDTDTIGAMAGSLTGSWLGYTAIPEEWATLMADYTYFGKAAQFLTEIALGRRNDNPLRLGRYDPSGRHQSENIEVQLAAQQVWERRKVWHPFFGEGFVLKVESQEIANRRGRVMMATVKFDIGQTCKFTKYLGLTESRSGMRLS